MVWVCDIMAKHEEYIVTYILEWVGGGSVCVPVSFAYILRNGNLNIVLLLVKLYLVSHSLVTLLILSTHQRMRTRTLINLYDAVVVFYLSNSGCKTWVYGYTVSSYHNANKVYRQDDMQETVMTEQVNGQVQLSDQSRMEMIWPH
jgi:hypothetical protein